MGRWRMRGAESSEAGAVLGDLLPTIAEAATRLSAATVSRSLHSCLSGRCRQDCSRHCWLSSRPIMP
jgi:hypothetical protein